MKEQKNCDYITSREPNYFGDPLDDYPQRTQRIVESALSKIKVAKRSQQDLKKLFYHLLDHLANKRYQIALDQNTAKASKFGERRDAKTVLDRGECHFYTNLTGVYASYGEKLIEQFKHLVSPHGCKISFSSERCETSFSAEILSYEQLNDRGLLYPTKDLLTRAFERVYSEIYPAHEKPSRLKQFADLLEKNKFCAFFGAPSENRKIFIGALFLHRKGKKEMLSQYYTRIENGQWELPMLFHMDFFQIESMLEETAILFEAIICSKSSSESLKEQIALFRYLLSHIMPFCRGSASVQEWLTGAINQFHGLEFSENNSKSVDLEAFTTLSFEKFSGFLS